MRICELVMFVVIVDAGNTVAVAVASMVLATVLGGVEWAELVVPALSSEVCPVESIASLLVTHDDVIPVMGSIALLAVLPWLCSLVVARLLALVVISCAKELE